MHLSARTGSCRGTCSVQWGREETDGKENNGRGMDGVTCGEYSEASSTEEKNCRGMGSRVWSQDQKKEAQEAGLIESQSHEYVCERLPFDPMDTATVSILKDAWRSARPFQPLRKIHQLDLVLDANIRDRHLDELSA